MSEQATYTEHIYQEYHYKDFEPIHQREEIVRCRDCIGLVETWDGWECERFSGEYHRAEPDGFCAWGERRERESAEVWNQWSADDVTCSEES